MHAEAGEQTVPRGADAWCPYKSEDSRRLVYAILLAQLLSIVLAVTGISSAALTAQGVYAPTTQAFLSYCLLAVVHGAALLPCTQQLLARWQGGAKQPGLRRPCTSSSSSNVVIGVRGDASLCGEQQACVDSGSSKHSRWQRIRRLWPAFAALALIDVEANVLVVKAYQYTSLTSVTLLDCFTIPSVMLLSWLVLHSRYKPGHFVGAALCVSGLAVLVLGDAQSTPNAAPDAAGNALLGLLPSSLFHAHHEAGSEPSLRQLRNAGRHSSPDSSSGNGSSTGSTPLLGDGLVLLGAVLYSVCNVTQELLLGDVPPSELLAGLGVFAALLSGVQAALLGEWQQLLTVSAFSRLSVVGPMLGFACAMLCFYSLVPSVLVMGGATVLNISLLSSDAWAALARFVWFDGFQGWSAYFFLGSLCMVAAGIVVYALSGSPKNPSRRPSAVAGGVGECGNEASEGTAGAATAGMARSGTGGAGGYSMLKSEDDLEEQCMPLAVVRQ